MIADVNESGRISLRTETDQENELLKSWVEANVNNSEFFVACCNNKKCAFKFDLKDDNN
jgi:transcription initiation factor TFIID subunit TAF12